MLFNNHNTYIHMATTETSKAKAENPKERGSEKELFDAFIKEYAELVKKAKENPDEFMEKNMRIVDNPIKLSSIGITPNALIWKFCCTAGDIGEFMDTFFDGVAQRVFNWQETDKEGFVPIGYMRLVYGFDKSGDVCYSTSKGDFYKKEGTKQTALCLTHPAKRGVVHMDRWIRKALSEEVLGLPMVDEDTTVFDRDGVTDLILNRVTIMAKYADGIFVFKSYVEGIHCTNYLAVIEAKNKMVNPVTKYRVESLPYCWEALFGAYKTDEGWLTERASLCLNLTSTGDKEKELIQSWHLQNNVRCRLAVIDSVLETDE